MQIYLILTPVTMIIDDRTKSFAKNLFMRSRESEVGQLIVM